MTYHRLVRLRHLRVYVSLYPMPSPRWFWHTGRLLHGRTMQVRCCGHDLFVVARVAA